MVTKAMSKLGIRIQDLEVKKGIKYIDNTNLQPITLVKESTARKTLDYLQSQEIIQMMGPLE